MLRHSITRIATALEFASAFAAAFYVLYYLAVNLNVALAAYAAQAASLLLSLLDVQNALAYAAYPQIAIRGATAEITDACSGAFEIAVLAAIMLASVRVPLAKRIRGALLGTLLILLFNPVRIAITLYAYAGSPALGFALHDALFRASLLVFTFAYYFLWLRWATNK